jgi:uncharacterized protein
MGDGGIDDMANKASPKKRARQKKGLPAATRASRALSGPKKKTRRLGALPGKKAKSITTGKPARKPPSFTKAKAPRVRSVGYGSGARTAIKTTNVPADRKPASGAATFVDSMELPVSYGRTRVTLIARDPHSVYAYWEITPAALGDAKAKLGASFRKASRAMRMFDVTGIDFNGTNAHSQFDVDVDAKAHNRYIVLPSDNVTVCAELGLRTRQGAFYPLARSNPVSTPSANVSDCSEITWAKVRHQQGSKPHIIAQEVLPAATAKAGGHLAIESGRPDEAEKSEGAGGTGPKDMPLLSVLELTGEQGALQNLSSPSLAQAESWFSADAAGSSDTLGGASEQVRRHKDFFFQLNAELIVYGRTEPGASVTMDGHPLQLFADGTFSERLALPDGVFPLEFRARSAVGIDERAIAITVQRTTFTKP